MIGQQQYNISGDLRIQNGFTVVFQRNHSIRDYQKESTISNMKCT